MTGTVWSTGGQVDFDRGWGRPVDVAASNESPGLIVLDQLSDDEQDLVSLLQRQLTRSTLHNETRRTYYEAKYRVRDFGIATPPQLRNVQTVIGWPGTAVDVLEERLNLRNFYVPSGEDIGLDDIIDDNQLLLEAGPAHLDALICGIAFITVGRGAADEPDVLVTVESPFTTTALWDHRRRQIGAALTIIPSDDPNTSSPQQAALYLRDETITMQPDSARKWHVVDRDRHNLGRALVARLGNRVTNSRPYGRSEITNPIMAYTDAGVRTLLGMEVNREFYVAPQRYLLGGDESTFEDADGNKISQWQAIAGRVWTYPRDEETGELPEIGQFPQSSPGPFLDQVRGLSQLVSAESAIPPNYLGFVADQPASADAIRAGEARLVVRAERRHATFGAGWSDALGLALLVRDGQRPGERIRANWVNAATPTRAAAADEASKLIAAGVLPPTSSVTYDRLGFSLDEQQRLDHERRRDEARRRLDTLAQVARRGESDEPAGGRPPVPPGVAGAATAAQSPRIPSVGDRADR